MKNLFLGLIGLVFITSCQSPQNPTSSSEVSTPFRDLNKNGKKDIYEDATQPIEKRIKDLVVQMTVEEKAGLMFNAISGLEFGETIERIDSFITQVKINHLDMPGMATAKEHIAHNNIVQKIAEKSRLGIPVTFYSDPRHNIRFNEKAGPNRFHSYWPSELGLGAIGDAALVRTFGDIERQEYLALGIRLALHPMADLATEPRWFRNYTTFGENADLSAKLTKAYIQGFQGEQLGTHSVLCQTKHFPGGGPQKDGMDAHFPTGKEQVYPGGMFDYHLKPFTEGALPAGTAQLMLYYGVPVGITEEQVAFGYNKEIVTNLLRDSLGFDGVVCTDWALVTDNPAKPASAWGVEHLSAKERVKKILDAGVDMFGGESCAELVVELVNEGSITQARLDQSVRRILHDKFVLGLFDNPYLSEDNLKVFENETYKELGREAQRKSLVLLKNDDHILPLAQNTKVYVKGIDAKALEEYATIVETPELADVIINKFGTPFTPVTEPKYFLERVFLQGRLDFPATEKQEMLDLINTKPTISIFTMNRPAVIPDINKASKALIVDFDCQDEILTELIFGKFKPTGKLPIELPSSVAAVEAQLEDVPQDSKNPLYPYGFGLSFHKQEVKSGAIEVEGKNRVFEYFAPPTFTSAPSLVFVLHGSRGTMYDARWQTNYEFERLAAARGNQIIVYPQGYDKHWNDCRGSASYTANQEDINDLAFFTKMIDYFEQQYQINKEAVFVTGISNGGQMCYKLGYELPNKFKGIAPFVANLPEDANNDCTPKNVSVSVMVINGTKDRINPHAGGWVVLGQDSTRGAVQATEKTIAYWKNLLNCETRVEKIAYDDYCKEDNSTVIHYKYACPTTNKKVELLEVIGGGHVVPVKDTPDLPEEAKRFIGNKNRDINAPMIVLDFFDSLVE